MATVLEMTASIVASHAQTTTMTTDEILIELRELYKVLHALERGVSTEAVSSEEAETPAITIKQAFKTNEVICLICGKGKMQTLTRHLNQAHQMKPSQYRKQFSLPKTQKLMSKSYAAKRKEIAVGMDLGANLEKARAARKNPAEKSKTIMQVHQLRKK